MNDMFKEGLKGKKKNKPILSWIREENLLLVILPISRKAVLKNIHGADFFSTHCYFMPAKLIALNVKIYSPPPFQNQVKSWLQNLMNRTSII